MIDESRHVSLFGWIDNLSGTETHQISTDILSVSLHLILANLRLNIVNLSNVLNNEGSLRYKLGGPQTPAFIPGLKGIDGPLQSQLELSVMTTLSTGTALSLTLSADESIYAFLSAVKGELGIGKLLRSGQITRDAVADVDV